MSVHPVHKFKSCYEPIMVITGRSRWISRSHIYREGYIYLLKHLLVSTEQNSRIGVGKYFW